ncbi:MAG: hypothetical protein HY762_00170 [Planctomycetes bacterium]|nr:hypothetical protein [Planctomycetota bacterium]
MTPIKAIIYGFLSCIIVALIGVILLIIGGGWGPCGPASSTANIAISFFSVGLNVVHIAHLESYFGLSIIVFIMVQGLSCSIIGYLFILLKGIIKPKSQISVPWFMAIVTIIFGIISVIHYYTCWTLSVG